MTSLFCSAYRILILMKFHKRFHSCEPNAFAKNNDCLLLRFGRKKYNLAYSDCIDRVELFISREKKDTVEDFTLSGFRLVTALNFQ